MNTKRLLLVGLAALPLVMGQIACGDDDNNNQNNNAVLCGNGQVDPGEDCDGADLGGATCTSLGMTGDSLACTATCTFDRSGCHGCGNGVLEVGEECDGSDLGSQTCANSGFQDGELHCNADCSVDVSGCVGGCGNGVLEGGEECDPPDGTTCNADCTLVGGDECSDPDSYASDCETATTGQWCWDGGDGGSLFCGCDPQYGDADCQVAGYERCNPTTMRCEMPPDCGNDANESNDDEAHATQLTVGTPATGATCHYDPDWFVFTAGSDAADVLVTWSDDGGTDLDIQVTDCATAVLGQGLSADAAQELLTVTDLTAGDDYCVLVDHYSGAADGSDVTYSLTVTNRTGCKMDADCTGGDLCPLVGSQAGVCVTPPLPNAGCGDDIAGDNDTSSQAEPLTAGTPITGEGSCDGAANGLPDVDFFSFTLAAGDHLTLTMNETTFTPSSGDLDLLLLDATGEIWASSATVSNPEVITGSGIPAGTYYAVVYYYDNDTSAAGSTTYDISLTTTAGGGCVNRDDCAAFTARGECTGGSCVAFDGGGSQGPGAFCDDAADCDPNPTGSQFLNGGACANPNPTRAADNVCSIDCSSDADCTPHGMHCFIADPNSGTGLCLAPCQTDVDCYGNTCTPSTGVCSL